ncbi:MAG: hypothetical protein Q8Q94_00415 [bacterium]|nr:hypothetical protein [bacterium]
MNDKKLPPFVSEILELPFFQEEDEGDTEESEASEEEISEEVSQGEIYRMILNHLLDLPAFRELKEEKEQQKERDP